MPLERPPGTLDRRLAVDLGNLRAASTSSTATAASPARTRENCPEQPEVRTRNRGPPPGSAPRPGPMTCFARTARTPAPTGARTRRRRRPTRWTAGEVATATAPTRLRSPRGALPQRKTASPSPRRSARTWSSCSGRRTSRPSVLRSPSGTTSPARATTRALSIRPHPPHVIPNGVQLDPTSWAAASSSVNSPSLDFGSGDFAIIVVAGLASSTTPVTFFQKSDGALARTVVRFPSTGCSHRLSPVDHRGPLNDTPLLTDTDTSSTVGGRVRPSAGDRPCRAPPERSRARQC